MQSTTMTMAINSIFSNNWVSLHLNNNQPDTLNNWDALCHGEITRNKCSSCQNKESCHKERTHANLSNIFTKLIAPQPGVIFVGCVRFAAQRTGCMRVPLVLSSKSHKASHHSSREPSGDTTTFCWSYALRWHDYCDSLNFYEILLKSRAEVHAPKPHKALAATHFAGAWTHQWISLQ